MIDLDSCDLLKGTACSLKISSRNKHDKNAASKYMTESALEVYNFDAVQKKYNRERKLAEKLASCDSFYEDKEGGMFFIEFKSGDVDKYNLRRKVYDSMFVLSDILDISIKYARDRLSYILVYEKSKHPYTSEEKETLGETPESLAYTGHYLSRMSKKRFIRFGLQLFENYCFKEVYTIPKEEFEKGFVSKWEGNL